MNLKKGYLVIPKDEIYGVPVVATSSREAKKIAFHEFMGDCEWIDLRVLHHTIPEAVADLPIGIIHDYVLALRRGIFTILNETKCERCGGIGSVQMYRELMLCDNCLELTEEKDGS